MASLNFDPPSNAGEAIARPFIFEDVCLLVGHFEELVLTSLEMSLFYRLSSKIEKLSNHKEGT
jgi:hypothetical protein